MEITRRQVLGAAAGLAMVAVARGAEEPAAEPIIDIHQHTNYSGRNDDDLIAHQRRMGISLTILLPAGTPVDMASTHFGKSNGLQAQCLGFDSVAAIAKKYPTQYIYFANEVPDLPDARKTIEKQIKMGAKGIGEQKFGVDCDSKEMEALADLAGEYGVPMLMHFQHEMYNYHFERFGKMLEKYPKTNFIGHAQTFWANIDKNHSDQKVLYPKTKVTPGGITDVYLKDYPNLYGDMSAGSGLGAFGRDEEQGKAFLERHQNKLLYGSDCSDKAGTGAVCSGYLQIIQIRRLAPNKSIERKILYENSKKLFKL